MKDKILFHYTLSHQSTLEFEKLLDEGYTVTSAIPVLDTDYQRGSKTESIIYTLEKERMYVNINKDSGVGIVR